MFRSCVACCFHNVKGSRTSPAGGSLSGSSATRGEHPKGVASLGARTMPAGAQAQGCWPAKSTPLGGEEDSRERRAFPSHAGLCSQVPGASGRVSEDARKRCVAGITTRSGMLRAAHEPAGSENCRLGSVVSRGGRETWIHRPAENQAL